MTKLPGRPTPRSATKAEGVWGELLGIRGWLAQQTLPSLLLALAPELEPLFLLRNHGLHEGFSKLIIFPFRAKERACGRLLIWYEFEELIHYF